MPGKKKGYDAGSIVADRGFVDPANGDFRLKPGSPAKKIGFKPIDIGNCGLVGPAEWTDLPKEVKLPPIKMPGEN